METADKIIAELQAVLPPVFAGQSLDEFTGKAIIWRTIQNARSRREIPADCFGYAGQKVLIVRDPFLAWWRSKLRTSEGRKAEEGRGDA
uniref:Uncharacterized protein n=1 Tax=Desulfovibrio sp. U5L TaxID=596152 RepID=I2Q5E4_9BACT